jgi:Fe-Mn family superoxide dismutase
MQEHHSPSLLPSPDRRTLLLGAAAGAALVGTGFAGALQDAASSAATLPELPYPADALEPVIGKRIMELHHSKHHAAYVKGLNGALEGHADLAKLAPEDLMRRLDSVPEGIRTKVRNHGGGHVNHSMFWQIMAPPGAGKSEPEGELADALKSTFGDLARFQEAFNKAGGDQFGSGWAWLTMAKDGKLAVESTANQDTPLSAGKEVVLGNDVWEHAYYLTYENRRGDYLKAWWKVVNWREVADRYGKAKARVEGK